MDELVQDLSGAANDNTDSFTYNPAGQIASRTRSNTGYSYASHINIDTLFGHNGLNEITSVTGSTAPTYDARGNMTSDGHNSFGFDQYNRLTSATVGTNTAVLDYDPMGRLETYTTLSGTDQDVVYDGIDMLVWEVSGSITRRWVHSPGTNEPLVEYTGSGTTNRAFLHADARGSIIAHTDSTGAQTASFAYDEYGNPAGSSFSTYGYTGHLYLAELGINHAHNRAYHPELMRFLQTDPIGVAGGINLYAYVGGDPVNYTDPLGLFADDEPPEIITIRGRRPTCPIGAICDPDDIQRFLDQFLGDDPLIDPGLADLIGDLGLGDGEDDGEEQCAELLSYTTVQRNDQQWAIQWQVYDPSNQGGVIIQEVYIPGATPERFFEAWQYNPYIGAYPNGTLPNGDAYDDLFRPGPRPSVSGTARYYPGQTIPSDFTVNLNWPSGLLPSSTTNPNLDSSEASCEVNRSFP